MTAVQDWPLIQVNVTEDQGEVIVAGTPARVVEADNIDNARVAAIALVVETATELGRAVRVVATDPTHTFGLIVHPNGDVEPDGRPAPRPATIVVPEPTATVAAEPAPAKRPTSSVLLAPIRPASTTTPAAAAPGPRRRLPLLAGGVLACLATGVGGWLLHSATVPAPGLTEADNAAAETVWQERQRQLQDAVDRGAALLTETEGQVENEGTRTALAAQTAAGSAFLAATSEAEQPLRAIRDGDDVVLYLDPEWDPGYAALTQTVTDAMAQVSADHDQWAYSSLSSTMQTAQATLDASVDQVSDPATRDTLSAAIADGQTLWDAGTGETPARDLLAARDAITAAVPAVDASRATWAHDALTSAVATGRGVLDGSNGQVTDNAVRDALFLALNHGQLVLDAGVGATNVTDTLAARDLVTTNTTTVQSAVTQWQSAQPQG